MEPGNIIIHCGLNDLTKGSIEEVNDQFKELNNDECVKSLKELCRREKSYTYIFHNNINSEEDKYYRKDRIHLSEKGTKILVANIKSHLSKAKTLTGKVKTETSNNRKDNQNNEMLKSSLKDS